MSDKLVEFKTLRKKIENMISNIRECGFDTQEYSDLYNEIVNDRKLESIRDKLLKSDNLESSLDLVYQGLIDKLKKLEEMLLVYDVYFKALNITNYVNERLNKTEQTVNKNNILIEKNFSEEQINYLVDSMIEVLTLVRNTNDIEGNNIIIKDMYNTAYQIIKLEVLTKNESRLYDYVKNYQLDLSFINSCLEDELDKLDLSEEKYNKLSLKRLEQSGMVLGQDYFDLETIKLLLNCDNSMGNKISLILKDNIKSVCELKDDFDNNLIKLYSSNETLQKEQTRMHGYKKCFQKKLISFLLALVTFVSIGYGISRGVKKLSTYKQYNRSITTYSDWNGLNVTNDCKEVGILNGGVYYNELNLKEYGLWKNIDDNTYEREIKVYDVSNYDFQNIEDYVNYGVENYGVSYDLETEVVDGDVQHYSNPYIEVEKIVVDNPLTYVKRDEYITGTIGFNFGVLLISYMFSVLGSKYGLFIDQIIEMKKYLGYCKECKRYSLEPLEKMKSIILEIQNIININEKLKLEFNRLYEENKFLLNNPEELYRRFEEVSSKITFSSIGLENDNVKKLTKGK